MKDSYVRMQEISKTFGRVEALNRVSLEIRTGEVLAIVGDNGAGKSTLIKILSGVLAPDQGTILVGEKVYSRLKPAASISLGISTVFQDLALVDTLDVPDNLFLGRERTLVRGWLDRRKMRQESGKLLEDLGIKIPDLSSPVSRLSGGQRQGVAVARAVLQGGEILIFDEPTAAMGVQETVAVLRLIRRLADRGHGVVVISHNMDQVFEISDRIAVMRRGRVVHSLLTRETNPQRVIALITGALDGRAEETGGPDDGRND